MFKLGNEGGRLNPSHGTGGGSPPLPWLEVIIKPIPRCYLAQGTACSPVGSTMACTDACHDQLSCTCILFNNQRIWNRGIEC